MSDKRVHRLTNENRKWLASLVDTAPAGHMVTVQPPTRTLEQNAMLHSIFQAVANSEQKWNSKRRTAEEWKFLLVSAHAEATKRPGEFGIGFEGERLMLRPSTAAMSIAEMTSLIEYCLAWCAERGIQLREEEPGVIAR